MEPILTFHYNIQSSSQQIPFYKLDTLSSIQPGEVINEELQHQ